MRYTTRISNDCYLEIYKEKQLVSEAADEEKSTPLSIEAIEKPMLTSIIAPKCNSNKISKSMMIDNYFNTVYLNRVIVD